MGKRLHEPRARAVPLRLLFLAANAAVARRPGPSSSRSLLPVGREFCLSIDLGRLIDALRPRNMPLQQPLCVHMYMTCRGPPAPHSETAGERGDEDDDGQAGAQRQGSSGEVSPRAARPARLVMPVASLTRRSERERSTPAQMARGALMNTG
eukprot:scaffold5586_cov124-Isochrysis_galbana.AAC.24